MLDIIYVALPLALFALVAMLAKALEERNPRALGAGRSERENGQEQA